jgi:dynein intermediate chain
MRKMRKEAPAETKRAEPAPASESVDVDSLVNSLLTAEFKEPVKPTGGAAPAASLESVTEQKVPSASIPPTQSRIKNLSISKNLVAVNILPVSRETYDKSCQTEDSDDAPEEDIKDSAALSPSRNNRAASVNLASNQKERRPSVDFSSAPPAPGPADAVVAKKILTAEEQAEILSSEGFHVFLDSSAKVIERVLEQVSTSFDYLRDYRSDDNGVVGATENKTLNIVKHFTDPMLAGRPVMDLQTCPHYPELFIAAYGSVGQVKDPWSGISNASGTTQEAAGVACVWSLALPSRPEFVFTATSPVLTAQFHPSDQHLVIGGCYSGQILLWDMRAKSLPVQRSSLAGRGHKHPVYCLKDVDTATAHEVISASTDGLVCHWDISRLSDPIITSTVSFSARADGSAGPGLLIESAPPSIKSACITSMAFGRTEGSRDVFMGTDSGKLLRTALPIKASDATSSQVSYAE